MPSTHQAKQRGFGFGFGSLDRGYPALQYESTSSIWTKDARSRPCDNHLVIGLSMSSRKHKNRSRASCSDSAQQVNSSSTRKSSSILSTQKHQNSRTKNMHTGQPHFKLYSSPASQWAGVPLLGLAEKAYDEKEYEVENVDLSEYSVAQLCHEYGP